MEEITIQGLLELYPREQVKQILVDNGIARSLSHAGFIIAVAMQEIDGDVIVLEDPPDSENKNPE